MQTISINPKFEMLNEYFSFYMTEAEYLEKDRIITEATGFRFFADNHPYAEYKAERLHGLKTKAHNLEVTFNPKTVNELLIKFNLHDHYSDILFVLAMFDQIPGDSFTFGNPTDEGIRESLEELKVLQYVLSRNRIWGDNQIVLRSKTKKKILAEINDPETVRDILESIGELFIKKGGYYDTAEKRFLSLHELDPKGIESDIENLRKKKPGRKPGPNQGMASFIGRFVDFLNNETLLKAQPNKSISNEQCRLIFKLLVILGIIHEQKIGSNEEDYIRTILRNATTR